MAGLLDLFSSDDPQQQGLLSAAAQVLNTSGPSLMPHSLGQVVGAGYGGFQAGRQQALDRQKEQMQMEMLQQQVAQATRKNDLINQFLAANLGGPGVSGSAGPAAASQAAGVAPAVPQSSSTGASGFGGVPSAAIAADLAFNNGQKMGDWINDRSKPTDFNRQLTQAGIDPNSPLGRQLQQANIAKTNYVEPVNARPGSILRDPFTQKPVAFNPQIPEGSTPLFDASDNVIGVSPIAGAADVTQTMSRAKAAGPASVKPTTGYDVHGNPVFISELDAATGGNGGSAPAGQGKGEPMPGQPGFDVRHMSPTQKAAFYKQAEAQFGLRPGANPGSSVIRPGLAPGVGKSIDGNVDTMNSDFADLYNANKNAPTTLALLDNIKQFAPQAITGKNADFLERINGILALGGLQKQKDLATATDLLNKNANMLAIKMRLGAGGGGSDALQALAQASNPNNHMQPEAIAKAADEVAGQVKMGQALYNQLLPFKMKNDVQGYFGAQQQFASQADPRKYQPDAQQPPAQQQPKPTAPQTFPMLPPAAQFAGKRMRADNGTIYRSDGTKWIKE